ncbi:hypothetical protein [uncultured Victivallis sp.]|uniref:hypothetical protein n=1 Tax=uncultured Victivallis sp. TaxID=354118 RepID=UPI00258DE7F7|nr:hypothetical protein [uncultured Victivallis sp.]
MRANGLEAITLTFVNGCPDTVSPSPAFFNFGKHVSAGFAEKFRLRRAAETVRLIARDGSGAAVCVDSRIQRDRSGSGRSAKRFSEEEAWKKVDFPGGRRKKMNFYFHLNRIAFSIELE